MLSVLSVLGSMLGLKRNGPVPLTSLVMTGLRPLKPSNHAVHIVRLHPGLMELPPIDVAKLCSAYSMLNFQHHTVFRQARTRGCLGVYRRLETLWTWGLLESQC